MTSITIRNIEGELEEQLRVRATRHGRSVEDEAREILRTALEQATAPRRSCAAEKGLATAIRSRVAILGGVDLAIPDREPMREPVVFERDDD